MLPARLLLVGGAFLVVPIFVYAALTPEASEKLPSSTSIRRCYTGQASTYNPRCETDPREKAWGDKTATGVPYRENDWSAAIRLDIARSERCGIGSGGVCYAAVQVPGGRAAILKITDNGPLTAKRIIDLNEKSMRYLSYEKSGNCQGLIDNVRVCLLNGDQSAYLGPVDEKDSAEWAKRVISAPEGVPPPYQVPPPTQVPPPPNYSSLFGPTTQPNFAQPTAFPPQTGGSQVGQYFSNPTYTALPTGSLFPTLSATNSPATGQPQTVAEKLLDLLRPQAPKAAETVKGTPIAVGSKLGDTATLGGNDSKNGSNVETVPIPSQKGEQIHQQQQTYQVAPQTFAQTVIMEERPPYQPPTVETQQNPLSIVALLELMKNTLLRILEMLRVL